MNASLQLARFLSQSDLEGKAKLNPATGLYESYQDSGGVWTIYAGHTHGVTEGMTCDDAQGQEWLLSDMQAASDDVNHHVTTPRTQNEHDALTSFVFNLGPGALLEAAIPTYFANNRKQGAADAMQAFNKIRIKGVKTYSVGLDKRRKAEGILLLGKPWQITRYANDHIPVLSTATLTRIMEAYV